MSDDKGKAKGKGKKKATGKGPGGGRGKGGAKRRQGLGADLKEARVRFLEGVRERLDRLDGGGTGEGDADVAGEERERLVRRVEARIARREEVKAQLTARIDEEIARDREVLERLKREGQEVARLIEKAKKEKKPGGKPKKPGGGKDGKGKKPGGKGGKPAKRGDAGP